MRARWAAIALVGALVAVSACDAESEPEPGDRAPTTTTTTTTTATTTTTTTAPGPIPPGSAPIGYALVGAEAVTADGRVCQLCLWLADTPALREQGLMRVTDLNGADGMVFRYEAPHSGAFWMKDTPLPLTIAFYDASGAYLDAFDMEPCAAEPCAVYPTPRDFLYAIEIEQGRATELGLEPASVITISDLPCDP